MTRVKEITAVTLVAIVLIMTTAHAENWVAVGVAGGNLQSQIKGQTVYVDMDRVERKDSLTHIWIKVGLNQGMFSFNSFSASIEQVILNCEDRTFATSKSIGVKNDGELVFLKETIPVAEDFKKVVVGSPIGNHWIRFCPPKVVNLQSAVSADVQASKPTATPEIVEPSKPASPEISSGSGFFVTTDGYFVTNYHVVSEADEIVLVDVNLDIHAAKVVRVDKANDIAVLKADGRFKAIPVASSRTAKRGQSVITVGYPNADIQGLEPKVTEGIINSLSGLGNDARTFQVSVPLQSGNSGGPLVTLHGNVIGIVAMKLSALAVLEETGDLPQNVNYAVKSNYLTEVLLGIPGLKRKLLSPSNRPYKNVAELTNAIEGATALVIAAQPRPGTK